MARLILWLHRKSALYHATSTYGPRTLCGRPIEGKHWEREPTPPAAIDESVVDCRMCRKVILTLK